MSDETLDDEQPIVKYFTFRSSDLGEEFTVTADSACLSTTFANLIRNENNNASGYIQLQVKNQPNVNIDSVEHQINTTRMLRYISEYFHLWEDNVTHANYVKEQPIHHGDPSIILKEQDFVFINKSIDESVKKLIDDKSIIVDNLSDVAYSRSVTIRVLGELLSQVDEFLDITSLSNKIYAYIATIIWNSTIVDFAQAHSDEIFVAMQKKAIADWNSQNADRTIAAKIFQNSEDLATALDLTDLGDSSGEESNDESSGESSDESS